MPFDTPNRRHFLQSTAAATGGLLVPGWAAAQQSAAVIVSDADRPVAAQGVQFGDPQPGSVMVWSRSDRPARLVVEYAFDERFTNARKVMGPHALETTDFTARQDLAGLPEGREVFVRVSFQGLDNARAVSAPVTGRFTVAPAAPDTDFRHRPRARDVRFVWGGDTAGQGWGINQSFGGMRIYEAMRQRRPDFFVHSGDTIYADGPIAASVAAEDGRLWTNLVTPEVSKVAETLNEYRGRYRYNLLDDNLRRFNAEVPQIWQWDDHEITNNWSDSKDLSADTRYTEKNVPLLTARGMRAFLDYAPMRPFDARESQRVYRKVSHGPLMDLFVLDMRSYRGPNSANLQAQPGDTAAILGREQLDWLKQQLAQSRAVWKVIAADLPVGLGVPDGKDAQGQAKWEGVANGDNGAARGRELEIAELLTFIQRRHIRNTVWLTADVHYCAAHYYDPNKAVYSEFDPFWEFVAGPLNAGTFGPNVLDGTFGPQLAFVKAPAAGQANLSPYAGMQFFGEVNIDGRSGEFAVDLRDLNGTSVYRKALSPRWG